MWMLFLTFIFEAPNSFILMFSIVNTAQKELSFPHTKQVFTLHFLRTMNIETN